MGNSRIFGTNIPYDDITIARKLRSLCNLGGSIAPCYADEVQGRKLTLFQQSGLGDNPAGIMTVMDGAVYNREELIGAYSLGPVAGIESDAVLLSCLYQRLGRDCLSQLNGDFAFVLYDSEKRLLFGAVDRVGSKPLFYHHGSTGFEFCSQLLPLCVGNNYAIDDFARQCYFAMQYVPSPYSMIREVRKLGPGECFFYHFADDSLHTEQYWDLYSNSCGFAQPKSYTEAYEQSMSLLEDSVRLRLHADKKRMGVFLSGGIDSSTVSCFAHQMSPGIEAFSVGFSESDFDESYYAEKVAEQIGIRLHRFLFTPDDALKILDDLHLSYDEPMGDYSSLPTSFLCGKASEDIEVALGGDGGDEMFWGYPRYLRYYGYRHIFSIPRGIRTLLAELFHQVGKNRLSSSFRLENVQQLYLNRRHSNSAERFDPFAVQQQIGQVRYLYDNKDLLRAFNDFDIKSFMCHAYNVKLDRASVRAGIQTRTPMLDYRVVEYSRLLPIDYCYSKEMGQKRILRDYLYRSIDRTLFERKKRGFGVPLEAWFRNELKEYLCDTLDDHSAALLPDYDKSEILRIRDRHITGDTDQTLLLWLCVHYLTWYKAFKSI